MGRMKQFIDNFEGYTVLADVYFPDDANPQHVQTFIEPEFLTADTVKSVINQVSNRQFKRTPNKADLYIFKSYGDGVHTGQYDQLIKSISLTSKQCKKAWV